MAEQPQRRLGVEQTRGERDQWPSPPRRSRRGRVPGGGARISPPTTNERPEGLAEDPGGIVRMRRVDREAELEAAFGPRTKAIVVNTPHNPSGKVFTRAELEAIAALCRHYDTLAITDEIYEHIIYDGARHLSLASLPGMAERTITISGLSKTYSITGWRLAYAIASERLTSAIRKVHDFLTVGAPHPLQEAGAAALRLPASFYSELTAMYTRKRGALYAALNSAGLECSQPDGAYYIVADIGNFGFKDDFAAADFMLDEVGVAAVPGSSFYHRPELGHRKIRFTFSKSDETIASAAERLRHLQEKLAGRIEKI